MTQLTKCDACGKSSNEDVWVTTGTRKYIRVTVDWGQGLAHEYDFCSFECALKGFNRFEEAKSEFTEARLKRFLATTEVAQA